MKPSFTAFVLALGLSGVATATFAVDAAPQARFSSEQLRQDLSFIKDSLSKIHPDIYSSADAAELQSAFVRVEEALDQPMTQDQAWRQLATLNPVFADAHVAVISPEPRKQIATLLQSGHGLFPFEVSVDSAGQVYILSELGGASSPYAAASVEKINGVPTRGLAQTLLARTNGDTANFRAANLSTRWWWFYWKMFGTPNNYEFELKSPSGEIVVQVPASQRLPLWIAGSDATNFDRAFRFWSLSDDVSILTVSTFDWVDKKRFYEFTQRAFSSLREARTKTLVIDIRKNGGGDDDMWKEGILRYIAAKPYRHGSSFLLRVIEGRQRDGQKAGDLVEGQIQNWVQPGRDENLLFRGNVYVLVGSATYSSAVLFANVIQDFGFGKLIGVGGSARTRQSGGTQIYTLPNSRLQLLVPRFILDRPSGARSPQLLTPDLPLNGSLLDDDRLWDQLRTMLQRETARR